MLIDPADRDCGVCVNIKSVTQGYHTTTEIEISSRVDACERGK